MHSDVSKGLTMAFEEAMAHSIKLELDAWEGLALDLPDAEERRHRFIDFNPYMYLMRGTEHIGSNQ